MELHLKIIGILFIILALIHFILPKYFNWKEELSSLSIMNRQMMYIHSIFIAFFVFLVGVLCVTSSNDLVTTELGKTISLGLGIFFTARLFVQFFGYSSKTWRGKRFETVVHVLFSLFWGYVSFVFIMIHFG